MPCSRSRAALDPVAAVVGDDACDAAAESGQQLFRAKARLRLPTGVSMTTLRKALEAVTADLMVDVELADAD